MVAGDCKAPGNKTPKADEQFVHEHIKSFSVVESHNTRKDTNRKYLAPELNIKKQRYEESRSEISKDKNHAEDDKRVHVSTFDFEAVLSVLCSLGGDLYYK